MNLPAPTAIVGVNSPSEQQYLSIFRYIGDNLRNRPYQWPQLKRPYIFTTQTGVKNYQLPGDFYRILDSSQWDVTNQWPMRGPISDYNYNVRTFAVVSLQTRKAYRLIGPTQYLYNTSPYQQRSAGWFEIDPAGQNDTDQMFLGYLSGNWVWAKDWVTATVYTAGQVVSGNGNMYICTTGGTSGATRPSAEVDPVPTDGTVTWKVYRESYQVTSTNTNLHDNDLCLFDEDLMIEGMRWAYKQAKGQDFQQLRADWEQQLKSSFARFNGPVRINMDEINADGEDWPIIPDGSWSV